MYTINPYKIFIIRKSINSEIDRKFIKDNMSLSEAIRYVNNILLPKINLTLSDYFLKVDRAISTISGYCFTITVYNKYEIEDEFMIKLEDYECLPI